MSTLAATRSPLPTDSAKQRAKEELIQRMRAIVEGDGPAFGAGSSQASSRAAMGFGYLHEWFDETPGPLRGPVCLLTHLAGRALAEDGGYVVWVGRRCWPYGRLLARGGDRRLLERSVFVDAPNDAAKLWAVDVALRCEAVSAVVADGAGFDMAATRRLQLAAKAGRAVGLLARPPDERGERSAAATRWSVKPVVNRDGTRPRWRVTPLRCKAGAGSPLAHLRLPIDRDNAASIGNEPSATGHHHLEYDGVQGFIHLPAELGDRPAATPRPQSRRRTA